ncbi:AAA family ATPase [Caulobacter segnis]
MQFQRLRLSGFKSFVEPTEFRIEPGLTGIVGPNGCGKSNLLEALRWVMGRQLGQGHAGRRHGRRDLRRQRARDLPRNHADVALTIDNTDRTAPAQFNDDPVLEVVRRIDRGAGSTYRINGREVRARDVQLLFADALDGSQLAGPGPPGPDQRADRRQAAEPPDASWKRPPGSRACTPAAMQA